MRTYTRAPMAIVVELAGTFWRAQARLGDRNLNC